LFKFAAGRSAQLRAGTSQVVRCEAGDTDPGGVVFEQLPDDLLSQTPTGDAAAAVQWSEHVAVYNT